MAGHKDGQVTTYAKDTILASTAVLEIISVLIDATTRDNGNPEGATNLRPGLALVRDAVTGKYKHAAGTPAGGGDPAVPEDGADVVVLQHAIRDISSGDQTASAFYIATIWDDAVHSDNGVDWTSNKRISIMSRV